MHSSLLRQLKHPKPLLASITHPQILSKIHALLVVAGSLSHSQTPPHLVAAYSRFNDLLSARNLFDTLPQPTVSAYNALISAYSHHRSPRKILDLYARLAYGNNGAVPDSSAFTLALKACTQLSDLKTGEEIRKHAFGLGYGNDLFVCSSLVNLYAKCGRMEDALEVFEGMEKRDLVSWTTMISGFVGCGRAMDAIRVYRRMRVDGLEGDEIVMVGLAQACAGVGDARMGLSVHGRMVRFGMRMNVVIGTSLVDMYGKIGRLAVASIVFVKMENKNVVSWSALISGYAHDGLASDALRLLIEMQGCGFEPDEVGLVSALLACSQIGSLKLGKSVHGFITRRHTLERISGTAMIDMYSKCGSLRSACTLFERISSRDLISWNAMIASYGIHGRGKEALSLFLEMQKLGMTPNDATFASLLSAFSHSGLVKEGRYLFNLMVKEFGIVPEEKHFACMVDLLARSGHVDEAYSLIKSMAMEPGIAVWVALLSGCQTHKKFELGEFVAKRVVELNPIDLGIHTLVSNVYAAAKKWDKVAEARRAMRNLGMQKVPGYSLVEVNGKFHVFLMEDKSHPEFEKIKIVVERLNCRMWKLAYIPKTEFLYHDLEEKL